MKRNPMTTLATLEAMVATKDPKERVQIFRRANPAHLADDTKFADVFKAIFSGAGV